MAILEVNNDQLSLIQNALDFYSRVGIGQFSVIKDHPTFQKNLWKECVPKKEPEVGDRTQQGEILEIKNGKALIDGSVIDGNWNKINEWKKLEDVKLSTDYESYHEMRDDADSILYQARNILSDDHSVGINGNWGIHNPKVDETCREAYDLIQVIRHEFYKAQDNPNPVTVDSSIHLTTKDSNNIKVTL